MNNIDISIAQLDVVWHDPKKNISKLEKFLSLGEHGQIVVVPEMFTTGFSMDIENMAESMQGESILELKRLASEYICILVGSLMIQEDGRYYNRLFWVQPDGRIYSYDKRHLFSLTQEPQLFTAGESRVICSVNGWHFLPQVCYDIRFPVWLRNQGDYDVMVVAASWPEARIYAWEQLLIARAIENQCYVIACTRVGTDPHGVSHCGGSMIVAPDGSICQKLMHSEGFLHHRLNYQKLVTFRKDFPFLADRDNFSIEK